MSTSAWNIEGFKNSVRNLQRSNLVLVSMVLPPVLSATSNGSNTKFTQTISFRASKGTFEAASASKVSQNFMGREVNFYSQRSYGQTWNTELILDEEWNGYKEIHAWLNAMNTQVSNVAYNPTGNQTTVTVPMNNYKTNCYVHSFKTTGEISKCIQLVGFFPTKISNIDVAWGDAAPINLSVEFSYDYWLPAYSQLGSSVITNTSANNSDIIKRYTS